MDVNSLWPFFFVFLRHKMEPYFILEWNSAMGWYSNSIVEFDLYRGEEHGARQGSTSTPLAHTFGHVVWVFLACWSAFSSAWQGRRKVHRLLYLVISTIMRKNMTRGSRETKRLRRVMNITPLPQKSLPAQWHRTRTDWKKYCSLCKL